MICIHCEDEFDPNCIAKKRAGGKINECPDCANEVAPRYLGLQAGDGKQAGITVLAFSNIADRERYKSFWQNNSGLHKSRSCQLGRHLSTDPGIKFNTVTQSTPTNHKGKIT